MDRRQASSKDAVSGLPSIVTLYTFIRWQVADDWFVNLVPPAYTWRKWTKIRLFELVTQVDYKTLLKTDL